MKKLYLNNWNVNATKILDEIDRQVKELGGEPAAQFGNDYYFAKEPVEVEGYDCLTIVDEEGNVNETVYPFDEHRTYPMQKMEQKLYFKRY